MGQGLNYQSINLVDMICGFSDQQMATLREYATTFDVPWYGIAGEIEKMGWEAYIPVRDGLTMATVIAAVKVSKDVKDFEDLPYNATEAGIRPFSQSLFNTKNVQARHRYFGKKNGKFIEDWTPAERILAYQNHAVTAIGTNVGANDLFNMYSSCNCCLMNYNGLQPDAGAVAEVGNLGGRGVPIVIMKGQVTGDFGGISNPMPTMSSSAVSLLTSHLTYPASGSVYAGLSTKQSALKHLQDRVKLYQDAHDAGYPDIIMDCNYNNEVPLPPLQMFWSDLGSRSYFLKHKSKSIKTIPKTGGTNFKADYTNFWYKNVVEVPTGSKNYMGLLTVGKAMLDGLDQILQEPKYKNILKYWS